MPGTGTTEAVFQLVEAPGTGRAACCFDQIWYLLKTDTEL